ncbi:MAG: motility protein A [Thermoguttaceae bacterium]|nr:motility protein A [Thermoguttaceae bacterium]MDW8077460.1 motility protein A [Thermoguttaceae bacterium]
MDIASLLGILLGFGFIVASILVSPGASIGGFIDYPSVMIVLGGATASVLLCFPLRTVLGAAQVFKVIFFNKPQDISKLIEQLVSLAETARRDGLLALENRLEEITDPFLALGIQMAVDGTQPEVIEETLRSQMEAVAARHNAGRKILDAFGKFAPAFGMIGTLIGLIIMLGQLSDPEKLGPGMAVALITTLYGAILANVVFLPAAEKLGYLHEQEMLAMEVIVRGIMAIQAGENPRVVAQKLATFVPPKARRQLKQAA